MTNQEIADAVSHIIADAIGLKLATEKPSFLDEYMAMADRTTDVQNLRDSPSMKQFREDYIAGRINADTLHQAVTLAIELLPIVKTLFPML